MSLESTSAGQPGAPSCSNGQQASSDSASIKANALHAFACRVSSLATDAHLALRLAECVPDIPLEHLPNDCEDYAYALRRCADLALQPSSFLNLYLVSGLSGSRSPADLWRRENPAGSILEPGFNHQLDALERFAAEECREKLQ